MMQLIQEIVFWYQARIKKSYLDKNLAKLENRDFTIISSNCWGGILYRDLGMSYQTPFVNMFIHAPCFIKMVSNLKDYLNLELVTTSKSKYLPGIETKYPIGLLGDVEIHFIHYFNNDMVINRWNERKARINFDKIILVLSERDLCTPEHVYAFDKLPFKNKLCFTVNAYPSCQSVIRLNSLSLFKEVFPADQIAGITYVKKDIIDYLNHANS